MIDLSIIIVHYNAKDDLIQCLDSIHKHKSKLTYEMIVIDNRSVDQNRIGKEIKSRWPNVEVILNAKNMGFASANNQGIRRARGKAILLLNPDTLITQGALLKLYTFLNSAREIGIVGPLIVNEKGGIEYNSARTFPNLLTELFLHSGLSKHYSKNRLFGKYLMTYWAHNSIREVDLVQGSCMMVKREVIDKVGYMDEQFFLFADDVEWCYRTKKKGYKIFFYAPSKIIHKGGTSSKNVRDIVFIIGFESMYKFFTIHYGAATGYLYRIFMFLVFSLKIAVCWLSYQHKFKTFFNVTLWSLGLLSYQRGQTGHPYLKRA